MRAESVTRRGRVLVALLLGLASIPACVSSQRGPLQDTPRTYVTFLSDPPGATVHVNGIRLDGVTPILHQSIEPGFVQVAMTLDGYQPAIDQRTLEPAAAVRIDLALVANATPSSTSASTPTPSERPRPTETPHIVVDLPPTPTATLEPTAAPTPTASVAAPVSAVVSFSSDPPGAAVLVNGLRIGTTPIEALEVDATKARISFSLDGFETVDLERRWQPGREDRVEVVLFPLRGSVVFDSDVRWSSIEIDGETVTLQPGESIALIEGLHRARAFHGDDEAHAEFQVESGTTTHVRLEWRRGRPDVQHYAHVAAGVATLGDAKYGEDNPPREVPVASFWMGRTEVTVEQYGACVAAGRCTPAGTEPSCNAGIADRVQHPINCVSVADAHAYAEWQSERTGLAHRLPNCDEWERAARHGGRHPWGDEAPESRCNTCDRNCPFVNFRAADADDGWRETAPVGALTNCRGSLGVFDLVGNVAEWCRGGEGYQVRGGSWGQVGVFLDPAFAVRRAADDRDATVGFRLVVAE